MAILEAGGGMEAGTEMCAAAALGQTDALSEFLQHGALPDQGDYDARTALHLAASEGHLETVRFLIEDAGAHHSPVDRWGGTPLDDAVRGQKHDVIKFLRDCSAQAGGGSKVDAVTLCVAAARGDVSGLREQVLSRGVSPDACDTDRRTAMHLAASEGRVDVLSFLVEEVRPAAPAPYSSPSAGAPICLGLGGS